MTEIKEEKQVHLSNFASLKNTDVHGWLDALRQRAMSRFEEVGFPSTKEEAWRFTNVGPLAKFPFGLAKYDGTGAEKTAKKFTFGPEAAAELVFVNGQFSAHLSELVSLPKGMRVESLASAIKGDQGHVEKYLAKYANINENPFTALNTGFLHDGAYVHLERGARVERPVHLLFISLPGTKPAVAHPRVLIVTEEGAELTVVESYVGSGWGTYFNNAVTEIVAGQGSRIDHCKLQQETLDTYHLATMQVELKREANFVSHSATLGGKLTRNDLEVVLNGEYAQATVNGLVFIGGDQHVDNHTLLRHEKPNCPSHELYKHVLADRSTGIFKGKIFVQKDAQKTDAKQTSKSLLLSDAATMESMPALEIYADDVKCTHGSTTGPVDEEMVFYLRSRGISLEAARHLLTYAFAADITRRIKVEPVRRRLEDYMAAQHDLPQDLRITDLAGHNEAAK